jgi:hypothetical protein
MTEGVVLTENVLQHKLPLHLAMEYGERGSIMMLAATGHVTTAAAKCIISALAVCACT